MGAADAVAAPDTMVGRTHELAVLRAALDSVRAGRPSFTLVVGEPGIGKTRLVDELALLARTEGVRVLRGAAERTWAESTGLWRGVRRSLEVAVTEDPTVPDGDRRWDQLDSLAAALTAAGPVLVVLEDLHGADDAGLWLLRQLPAALDGAAVALVATCRDQSPDRPLVAELRRVARVLDIDGLDVDGVRQLAAAQSRVPVDAAALAARTGGNPLFVQELLRHGDGTGLIDEALRAGLENFGPATKQALGLAAVAGPNTPIEVIAAAAGSTAAEVSRSLAPAVRARVLTAVAPDVRFRHALYADAAAAVDEPTDLHRRLASAWASVGGLDGRAGSVRHRLRALGDPRADPATDIVVETATAVAAELGAAGRQSQAADLLTEARRIAAVSTVRPELRVRLLLDLADVASWQGDLDLALACYQEAAELAPGADDPVLQARAELGANLYAPAFVPDLARMRRLEDALAALPADQRHLRASLLGRLTVIGRADPGATERVRGWADEAVAVARSTGDPVLIAQTLLDHSMAPTNRAEADAAALAADEVVRLAEQSGRPDLAVHGHQRRAGYDLDRGDLAAAGQALGRAEVLAAVLPSMSWRHGALVQRTTLLAVSGSRAAAVAAMAEAVRVGSGHIEPVVVTGCEAIHRLMLVDLYGHPDPRAEELHRVTSAMIADVPSPVFQVQRGFGAQVFGDHATVADVLHRYGPEPDLLLRSMTGDNLLRVFADTVARAREVVYAGPCYRALLPYAGRLNVGGGHSVGLPVDDVLGRLAALDGDPETAERHLRAGLDLARSMPAPPLVVHCLDHLADLLETRSGTPAGEPATLRAEAHRLAASYDVRRPGAVRPPQSPSALVTVQRDGPAWTLTSPFGRARVSDGKGVGQLARLLAAPGAEISALELDGRLQTPVAVDLGPGLDAQSKRAYRGRLRELQARETEAAAAGESAQAAAARLELDALVRELRRAVGLGGRDRPTGSDAERARINVTRSLRRAIGLVAEQAPLLGEHLAAAVRTGGFCRYQPLENAPRTDPSRGNSQWPERVFRAQEPVVATGKDDEKPS